MEREEIFSEIVEMILGEKIKIVINKMNVSGFNTDSKLSPTGIILDFKVKKIGISDHDKTRIKVFPYLSTFQQKVWNNLTGKLFTILHEIGHIKTLIGLNETEYLRAKEELIQNIWISPEEKNKRYRQLLIEQKADDWATQWVLDNPKLASYYSDLIESAYR